MRCLAFFAQTTAAELMTRLLSAAGCIFVLGCFTIRYSNYKKKKKGWM